MNRIPLGNTLRRNLAPAILLLLLPCRVAMAQDLVFHIDPAQTSIKITLGAALHVVHGTFQIKKAALQANPSSGKISGEIVVSASSGETGNGMRDRKMHKEVLETERYPDISFRPDRLDGTFAAQSKSSGKIHGSFSVHGTDHEVTIPAELEITADHWTAHAHFTIPYAKWGMKNPSNLFLHVSDDVEIDVAAAGTLTP